MNRVKRAICSFLLALIVVLLQTATSLLAQIPWTNDYAAAISASRNSGAMVMLHFYTDDCVPCKMLDARAFQDPNLINAIRQTVIPVKINASQFPQIARQHSVTRWPTDVYIASDGTELARSVSPQKTADYLALLERVAIRHRDHHIVKQNEMVAANSAAQIRTSNAPSIPPDNGLSQTQLNPIGVPGSYSTNSLLATSLQAPRARPAQTTNVFEPNYPATPPLNPSTSTLGASMFASSQPSNPSLATAPPSETNPYLQQQSSGQSQLVNGQGQLVSNSSPTIPKEVATTIAPESRDQDPSLELGKDQRVVENQFSNPQMYAQTNNVDLNPAGHESPTPATQQPVMASQQVANSQAFATQHQPQASIARATQEPAPTERPKQRRRPSVASTDADQTPRMPTEAEQEELMRAKISSEVQRVFANESGPAMAGYCPVTLDEVGDWRAGRKQFAVRHRGRVYHMASREYQKMFLEEPDRYAPVLSGYDLVHFLHTGKLKEGLREYGCWHKGRVYLFCNESNRAYFDRNIVNLAATAEALQNGGMSEDSEEDSYDEELMEEEEYLEEESQSGRVAEGIKVPVFAR